MSASADLPEAVIEVEGLVVRYGKVLGVSGVNLVVRRGQVCGLIGPNGAGKSTTMRVLATLQRPDEGRVRVSGWDVAQDPRWVRWRVGFMPDVFELPAGVTVVDYLRFTAAVHAMPRAQRDAAVDAVLELVDLRPHREKTLDALSKGMRQRAYLAKVLLPEPDVLILDEPASGLDPRARVEFRELVRELQRMGRTILISSHVLADLSEVCDALAIVEAGRTVACGPISEIRARMTARLVVRIRTVDGTAAIAEAVARHDGCSEVRAAGDVVTFHFAGDERAMAELLQRLSREGHLYSAVELDRPDVEDLFLQLTEGTLA